MNKLQDKKKTGKARKREIFSSLKGMKDIRGEEYYFYQGFFEKAQEVAVYYGFKPIESPIMEEEGVFTAGVGLGTDIVDKEMYLLRPPRSRDKLALRPEFTAGIMRAYLEHGMQSLPQPVMLYYYGPVFRHDNPQKGRLREFRQFGLEILGTEKSIADAIIIQATKVILEEVGTKDLCVEINSIGDKECRPTYLKELVAHYRKNIKNICDNCKRRLKENPLRVLDCKDPECQPIKEESPDPISFLCGDCKEHFREVLEYLEKLGITYRLNRNLVRGLGYYTRTVFEIVAEERGENTKSGQEEKEKPMELGGGGRYDYLAQALGSKREVPAVGVSLGADRIIQSPWYKKLAPRILKKPKIYFIQLGSEAKLKSLKVIEILRQTKVPIKQSLTDDSLSAQLAIAEKLKIQYTLIFGQKEALDDSIIIRNMENRSQKTVRLDELAKHLKELK